MPNYDFRCLDCNFRFEIFLSFSEYGKRKISCPQCHGLNIQRRIGRIRVSRSEDSRLEDLSDPAALDGLEENPQSMGKMLRKMRSQVGEEVAPEFDEVVGRLESGESPDQIESEMPGLSKGLGGTPPGDFEDES
jgi:putative FmdB family regulatory protein